MITTPPNPATAAETLWDNLIDWQPATAAALLIRLREFPTDWPLRVFGVGRPYAALDLPPGAEGELYDDRAPEIAPYAVMDDLDALKADQTVTVKAFLANLDNDEVDG